MMRRRVRIRCNTSDREEALSILLSCRWSSKFWSYSWVGQGASSKCFRPRPSGTPTLEPSKSKAALSSDKLSATCFATSASSSGRSLCSVLTAPFSNSSQTGEICLNFGPWSAMMAFTAASCDTGAVGCHIHLSTIPCTRSYHISMYASCALAKLSQCTPSVLLRKHSQGSKSRWSKASLAWIATNTVHSLDNSTFSQVLLRPTMTWLWSNNLSMRPSIGTNSGLQERCQCPGTNEMTLVITWCWTGKASESMRIRSARARSSCCLNSWSKS